MILLRDDINVISGDYESYILEKCENFNPTEIPFEEGGLKNFFYRQHLNINEEPNKSVFEKMLLEIQNTFGIDNNLTGALWINKVDKDSNQLDDFHTDNTFMSVITYINEDYIGGEFEYIDENGNVIKIEPKKNNTIFMDNKTKHKVNPVTEGVRFSLVFFFIKPTKNKKTII